MDESTFDKLARAELSDLEERFDDVDPDLIDVSSSDGVLTLSLQNGVRVVVNSHRAARQIWMAAVASAWHFDYVEGERAWRDSKSGAELRATLAGILADQVGVRVPLAPAE